MAPWLRVSSSAWAMLWRALSYESSVASTFNFFWITPRHNSSSEELSRETKIHKVPRLIPENLTGLWAGSQVLPGAAGLLHAVEGSLQFVGGDVSQTKGENPQLVSSLWAGDGDALRHQRAERVNVTETSGCTYWSQTLIYPLAPTEGDGGMCRAALEGQTAQNRSMSSNWNVPNITQRMFGGSRWLHQGERRKWSKWLEGEEHPGAHNREHEENTDDWGGLGVWSEPGDEFQSLQRSSPPPWRANITHAKTLALSLCPGGNVAFTVSDTWKHSCTVRMKMSFSISCTD